MCAATKICFVLLTITVAAVSFQQRVAYSENKTNHNDRTVLLGGLFPISWNDNNECGGLRTTAVEALEAMVFTIQQINNNRTLLPGVNLTFDIRDTCGIPNKALEKSLSFVQAPLDSSRNVDSMLAVSGIVGAGFFSHVSEAVASLFRLFQIPQISYGSSAAVLSDRVRFDYFFRTLPSDAFLARAMADVVNHFGWTYIMALHSDDTFGRSGLEIMLEKITGQNGTRKCVAIEIPMPLTATDADWDAIVARMNQPPVRNASVALLYGYRRQSSGIMKAITKLLQTDPDSPLRNMTWVGCEALLVHEEYPDLVHGMIRMQYKVNMSYDFQRHLTAMRPNSLPNNPHFRSYWETKFNCSIGGQAGLPRCDDFNLNSYKQKSEISSIVDAVHAFAHAVQGLIEEHCPNHELCSNITVRRAPGIAVNGTMIRDYLLNDLSFPGLSADTVEFDAAGNDHSSYVVQNLQRQPDGTYKYKVIGTWDPTSLLHFTSDVEWNAGSEVPLSVCSLPCENGSYPEYLRNQDCCWTCQPCLGDTVSTGETACSTCDVGFSPNKAKSECIENPVFYLTWSNPWGVIVVLATCLGLIVTGAVCVVFAVFHNHTVVKASSRELSAILLSGLLLCYILPFLFVAKPSVATCTLRRFLVGFSFTVCFSALLVKTNRLHRIFNRSSDQLKTKPRFINPLSQVVICFILIPVQAVIAVLWLSIEHPSVTYTHSSTVTELKCGESTDVGLVITLGYSLLLLILSTYFAFLARKIPENFNEAKFINVTLYTIIIIWLAFIPTYFATAKLGSVYQTSSLVIAIILSASTTLCCLFVPKLFLLGSQIIKEKKETINMSTPNTTTLSIATKLSNA